MQIVFSFIAFLIFISFIVFAFSLGAALIGVIIVSGFFLGMFMIVRGYYLRWKFRDMLTQYSSTNNDDHTTVIDIDGEYTDISHEKK